MCNRLHTIVRLWKENTYILFYSILFSSIIVQWLRNVRELVGGGELEGRSLWGVARSLLNQQEQQRFLLLTHVTTDLGRSRAWIRSAPVL
jgi:hypothetical protein